MTHHYLSTPKSWHIVTKPLEEMLTQHRVKILQMKEKFGGLRCYIDALEDSKMTGYEAELLIDFAEAIVEHIEERNND